MAPTTQRLIDARLLLWGGASLLAGVLVYALGRPAGSATFLPAGLSLDAHPPAAVSAALGPMPTLLHTLAFCLLTLAVLRPGLLVAAWVCAGWCALEIAFELSQGAVSPGAMAPAPAWVAGWFETRSWDPFDLGAAATGAALALFVAGGRHR